jgi:hypothetical protein
MAQNILDKEQLDTKENSAMQLDTEIPIPEKHSESSSIKSSYL